MNENWRHFSDQPSAQIYSDSQNSLFSEINPPSDLFTNLWSNPVQLQDGSWVVQSFKDNTAVQWNPEWQLPNS